MSDAADPVTRLATRVEGLVKVVSAAGAALLPLVLPDELVPTQLAAVTSASSLLALVAFMAVSTWGTALSARRGVVVAVGSGAALVMLGLNLGYVHLLPQVGQPPADHRVLVGYRVTPEGEEMLRNARALELPVEQQLVRVGIPAVERIYGASYTRVKWTYAASMVLAFLAVAAYLALVGEPPPSAPEPDPEPGPATPA